MNNLKSYNEQLIYILSALREINISNRLFIRFYFLSHLFLIFG